MSDLDAILIPGNGVRAGGELPSWVRLHLDRAIQIYNGEYVIALSAGTTHRPPPVDEQGFPMYESVAAARYLMARVEAVFRWIYGLDQPPVRYKLSFEGLYDSGMDEGVLNARIERERKRVSALADLTQRIKTMADFHRWLFTHHDAYSATRRGFGADEVRGPALDSY